jgi:hypothetical protein
VAELVDRADLAEHPATVGVVEEGHQPQWQLPTNREPASRDGEPTPGRREESDHEPAQQPTREPEHEPARERAHEPTYESNGSATS